MNGLLEDLGLAGKTRLVNGEFETLEELRASVREAVRRLRPAKVLTKNRDDDDD